MLARRTNRELWWALGAISLITLFYIYLTYGAQAIPAAGDFWGHWIGVIGFALMLFTETLYSLRKRSRSARWGRMSFWLEFHIFTGIVGPYMVLLHTSWTFNGLAGVVTLMMVIVVISGFIGRYIYTAVPRTAEGAEIEASMLRAQMVDLDAQLRQHLGEQPDSRLLAYVGKQAAPSRSTGNQITAFFSWGLADALETLRSKRERQGLPAREQAILGEMEQILHRRRSLARQVQSLAVARRLLGLWHAIHIPLGMALFTAAFVHIVAALYYATLLR